VKSLRAPSAGAELAGAAVEDLLNRSGRIGCLGPSALACYAGTVAGRAGCLISQLDREIAALLGEYQDAVRRLAEIPGLGVESARQIMAEVGAKAATFAAAKNLVSWVGACPGEEESAGVNRSKRSPKGNRHMRRILNQCANAAVRRKGSIFEILYRSGTSLGAQQSHRSNYSPPM
jgi:transposase